MLRHTILKGLLGASALAAMVGALAAQAQYTGTQGTAGTQQSTTGTQQQSTTGTQQQSTAGTQQQGSTGTQPQGTAGQSGTSGTSGSTTSGSTAAATAATATAALGKTDQKILMDIARANMAEIEAGKLAQSKSQNEQVKHFAQQMIDDHTKAQTEVQALAQAKGVALPTELDSKHKALIAKLSSLSGDAFDHTYMSQAGVADHKKVHSMLVHDHQRAKDPDVVALAGKMLPTVDQHLNAAQQMPGAKGAAKDSKSTASGDAADKDKVTTGGKRNQ